MCGISSNWQGRIINVFICNYPFKWPSRNRCDTFYNISIQKLDWLRVAHGPPHVHQVVSAHHLRLAHAPCCGISRWHPEIGSGAASLPVGSSCHDVQECESDGCHQFPLVSKKVHQLFLCITEQWGTSRDFLALNSLLKHANKERFYQTVATCKLMSKQAIIVRVVFFQASGLERSFA